MVEAEGVSGGQDGSESPDNSNVYAGSNVIQEFTIADA